MNNKFNWIFCHRGLWDKKEKQNSRSSILAATKNGFASEIDVRLANNLASYYDYPDGTGAIYTIFRDYIQFSPNNLYSANIIYLKKPDDMVWGYTMNGAVPEYSEALSTQPEWNDTDMNEIIYLALSYIGVNLKDPDVSQFAQLKTQTGL